jgi:hypothetical protein
MLILGFGLAMFFVAERVGQMTGAAWWEERLQEARRPSSSSLSREPPPPRAALRGSEAPLIDLSELGELRAMSFSA